MHWLLLVWGTGQHHRPDSHPISQPACGQQQRPSCPVTCHHQDGTWYVTEADRSHSRDVNKHQGLVPPRQGSTTSSCCIAHLPALCNELNAHNSHCGTINQPTLCQGVTGLQHPPLAQCTLPGPLEARQNGEAILWWPPHMCCNLQCRQFIRVVFGSLAEQLVRLRKEPGKKAPQ